MAVGSPPRVGPRATPTIQPMKAASIAPSMPMLTTPDRSQRTPTSAASAMGVADRRMIGAMIGDGSTR